MIKSEKKIKIPSYLKKLINRNPDIRSGRKNYLIHEKRILDTNQLIKNLKKK